MSPSSASFGPPSGSAGASTGSPGRGAPPDGLPSGRGAPHRAAGAAGAGRRGAHTQPRTGAARVAAPPAGGARVGTPGDPRFALLDLAGFRGMASVSVIIFHAYQFCRGDGSTPYAGAFLGEVLSAFDGMISWFFLVSAFLLYLPMISRTMEGRAQWTPRDTLIRRGLRILPLYYGAILVVWCARNPTLPGNWVDLVEHLTFTHVFDSERVFYTIGPAWSLAVEVYFYVYLATAGVWLTRRQTHRMPVANRWRRLVVPALVPVVISAVWVWYAVAVAHAREDQWAFWFSPQNHFGTFGFGMLVAVLYARRGADRPIPGLVAALLRLAGFAVIVAAALIRDHTAPRLEAFHVLNQAGFAIVLAGTVLAPRTSLWRRFFCLRGWVVLGMISYSVYLWHEPILLLVLERNGLVSSAPSAFPWVAALLVITGTAGGAISYFVLEAPARKLSILLERLRRVPEPAPG